MRNSNLIEDRIRKLLYELIGFSLRVTETFALLLSDYNAKAIQHQKNTIVGKIQFSDLSRYDDWYVQFKWFIHSIGEKKTSAEITTSEQKLQF